MILLVYNFWYRILMEYIPFQRAPYFKAVTGMKALYIMSIVMVVIYASAYAGPNEDLLRFAQKGDLAGMKKALGKKANVDVKNDKYLTPLILTAEKGHDKAVKLLIDAGAAVNTALSYTKETLLMAAALMGNEKICKLLVDAKADVNAVNNLGDTPLKRALILKKGISLKCSLMPRPK